MNRVYVSPSYSYAAPLDRWLASRDMTVVKAAPRRALDVLARGAAAAMTPIGSLVAAPPGLRVCPGPMVYSDYSTLSVAVVSATGMSLGMCSSIAVTSETRTSILYLVAVLKELGLSPRLVRANTHRYDELLSISPCALVIGDEALRAIASGLHVVADMGELVRDTLGIKPVYAASVSLSSCPSSLAEPPWPRPSLEDVLRTARTTGLDHGLAWLYHYRLLRFDYEPAALYKALSLLVDVFSENTHVPAPSAKMVHVPGLMVPS